MVCVYRRQVREVKEALGRIAGRVAAIGAAAGRGVSDPREQGGARTGLAREVQQQLLQVQVATVDAFQGEERKVILVSTVRSETQGTYQGIRQGRSGNMGFADDPRRVNVAVSRAMHHLVLVCCAASVRNFTRCWKEVDAIARRLPGGLRRFRGSSSGCLARGSGTVEQLLQGTAETGTPASLGALDRACDRLIAEYEGEGEGEGESQDKALSVSKTVPAVLADNCAAPSDTDTEPASASSRPTYSYPDQSGGLGLGVYPGASTGMREGRLEEQLGEKPGEQQNAAAKQPAPCS